MDERLYQELKARLLQDGHIIQLLKKVPEIDVTVERRRIQMNTGNLDGRMALLIAEGFFDQRKGNKDTLEELANRGWRDSAPNVSKSFGRMMKLGFLRQSGEGRYQAVAGMKVNIEEPI